MTVRSSQFAVMPPAGYANAVMPTARARRERSYASGTLRERSWQFAVGSSQASS